MVRRFEGLSVAVLEKETRIGLHQTSHNSGVVHAGLYYRPGSLKARLCVSGQRRLGDFCQEHGIPMRRTGKLVVASRSAELPALEELQRRGSENGLTGLERLGPAGLRDIEPNATGVAALHVPETGVVDFGAVAAALAEGVFAADGVVRTGAAVRGIERSSSTVTAHTDTASVTARVLVNCAGLYSDRVAELAGISPAARIIPFRGEYFTLADEAAHLVRALIYPVPDPRFPFLGVHFTRRIDDIVEVGPNAVPAFGREHYRGTRPDWGELWATLRSRRFLGLARRYWRTGAAELISSSSRHLYARRARRLVPALRGDHLRPAGSGVRAQAVLPDGTLVDDFVIEHEDTMIHVVNAPSPAATACLEIGDHIAALAAAKLC